MAAFLAIGAFLRAFLRASTFFTALSWATKAFFFSGDFALASAFLIAAILALRAFDFLPATDFVTFCTLAVILANLALAALSYLLIAAFFAFGAVRSFFLRAATFFWALSWATKTFFALELVTAAILALINATFFASAFMFALITLAAAFLAVALAFTILARMAAFFASGALLRAILRASTFFTALSWATNAFFFSGNLALASCFLISAILALRAFDFLPAKTFVFFWTLAVIFANLALAALS